MSELLNKEEEIQHRPFNPQLLGKLLTYLQPHKRRVALAFLTIAFSAFSSQVGPFLTQKAVDNHIAQGDYAGLKWIIAAFFASILVQYASQYAQTLVTEIMGQHIMLDIRRDIFAHLQNLPLRYFDRTPLGRIMTRFGLYGPIHTHCHCSIHVFHGCPADAHLFSRGASTGNFYFLSAEPGHGRLPRVSNAIGETQRLFAREYYRHRSRSAV